MTPPYSNGHTVGEDLHAEQELRDMLEQDQIVVLARYLNKMDQVQATVSGLRKDMSGLKFTVDSLQTQVRLLKTSIMQQCVVDIAPHRKSHHRATLKQDGWKAAIFSNSKEIVIAVLVIITFAMTGEVLMH